MKTTTFKPLLYIFLLSALFQLRAYGGTLPTISITSPSNGSIISGATFIFASSVSATAGIANVQYKFDNINLGVPVTVFPYSLTFNTNAAFNGSHTVAAIVTDLDGNTAYTDVTVTVSNILTAPVVPVQTGMYFAPLDKFRELKKACYDYVVTDVYVNDSAQWKTFLDSAEATGLQLILGVNTGGPQAYEKVNGVLGLTSDGVKLIEYLKTRSKLIKAFFVYNEPYWIDEFTYVNDGCGATSIADLRSVRTAIQKIWPEAKIYNDIGTPAWWATGGQGWNWTPCLAANDPYIDQTGIADYVGLWNYPFYKTGYDKTNAIEQLKYEINYVLTSMAPAQPILLGQSFAQDPNVMPSLTEILDWNAALRSLPSVGVSWYVWDQAPLYTDGLVNHPTYWPLLGDEKCGQINAVSHAGKVNSEQIAIYPNPSNGMITIDLHALKDESALIKVVTVLGEDVLQIQTTQPKQNLDLSLLANGIYSIQVQSNGSVFKKKFLLQK